MKKLRQFIDARIEPHFQKGGKYERYFPLYDLFDTILYSPARVAEGWCHIRDHLDQKRMMMIVVFAMFPPMLVGLYNVGYQVALTASVSGVELSGWRIVVMELLGLNVYTSTFLSNMVYGTLYFAPVLIVTMAVGGFWELVFAIWRKHEIAEGFLVTGFLIPLIMPPVIPLWQVALATSFGVIVGKEIFGGVGYNFLNPALTARAFIFFAYPAEISGDAIWVAVDGVTQATKLAVAATQGLEGVLSTPGTWLDAFLGFIPGSIGEVSTLACLLGAALLIATRVGSWQVMLSGLIGMVGSAFLLNVLAPFSSNPMFDVPAIWHLVIGGAAFGLVYMATDPVSSAMTIKGKYVYGALIGFMIIFIRTINPAYPEGVMLAILFMNVFAPIIDHYVIQSNIRLRLNNYGIRKV